MPMCARCQARRHRPVRGSISGDPLLGCGLPKIAAIAWYRLPFETVAVASFDEEFLSLPLSDAQRRQKICPGSTRGHVFEAQEISMRSPLALTRRERDHTNGSPGARVSDLPYGGTSCYFSRLLRNGYAFHGQGRSHLFFSCIIRWRLATVSGSSRRCRPM